MNLCDFLVYESLDQERQFSREPMCSISKVVKDETPNDIIQAAQWSADQLSNITGMKHSLKAILSYAEFKTLEASIYNLTIDIKLGDSNVTFIYYLIKLILLF
jgi:hypothetical protein